MEFPPEDHYICPCCGTQFGYDDVNHTFRQLRNIWLQAGGQWFNPECSYCLRDLRWNAWDHLDASGLPYDVPNAQREHREYSFQIPVESVMDSRELAVVDDAPNAQREQREYSFQIPVESVTHSRELAVVSG